MNLNSLLISLRQILLSWKAIPPSDLRESLVLSQNEGICYDSPPCHFKSLFIKHNGDVFPCCAIWGDPKWKIGNLQDSDLVNKIFIFDGGGCHCCWGNNRKATEGEIPDIQHLHLELSLKCQAICAMCSVKAPGWRGQYDLYEQLTHLVDYYKPKYISVQGGEILIQQKSVAWLESIKLKYPHIALRLVTNGGAEKYDSLDIIEKLFKVVSISFVGFQPETYKTIMGLDLSYTTTLASKLDKTNLSLRLKFLVTPLNLHEAAIFFKWAVTIAPSFIVMHDANIQNYINYSTEDLYWTKIQERSGKALRNEILQNYDILKQNNIKLHIQDKVKCLYGINSDFIKSNNLSMLFVTTIDENMD